MEAALRADIKQLQDKLADAQKQCALCDFDDSSVERCDHIEAQLMGKQREFRALESNKSSPPKSKAVGAEPENFSLPPGVSGNEAAAKAIFVTAEGTPRLEALESDVKELRVTYASRPHCCTIKQR